MSRRWALIVIQLTAVGVLLFFLGWAFRGAWHEARPRLRDASLSDLAISTAILGAYYLLFTVAWQRMLAAWGLHIPYFIALQAEMASILAKYVPGTVWIPAARIAALRRAGVRGSTPLVLSSMLMEAGLSALAGILVLFASLTTVGFSAAPVVPLLVLAVFTIVGLHPRVFTPGIARIFRRFGGAALPPLPYSTMLGLIAYYCCTWLVGGTALFFLLRSVGGHPSAADIPYLGGIAAVSAIVAVLSLITPSGLGVREASMYGLLLAITSNGVALGVTVLNRLTITIVEAALLLVGAVAWRYFPRPQPETGP
jgi:glycosyltransferase 2 family protein